MKRQVFVARWRPMSSVCGNLPRWEGGFWNKMKMWLHWNPNDTVGKDGQITDGWMDRLTCVHTAYFEVTHTFPPPLGKHGRWNGIKDQDCCRKNNFQVSWKDEYSRIPYESSRHEYVNIHWVEQKYLPNRARPRDPSLTVWTEPWQARFYSFNSFTLRWARRRGSWAISLNAMSNLRTDNKNKSHYCKQSPQPVFTTAQIIRKWLRNGFGD